MVKGITRRVIVIKSPDRKLFDEAIFIVREDALREGGVTGDEILKEAQDTADEYVRRHLGRRFPKLTLPLALSAAAGAALATAVWLLARILF
ncbi:MAG: translation initiation factor 2 [Oscillospiraceae bacterium]|jgi:hypothetical protein|nr:translation initiation factor 2 [Oscillospiraceae bacterium]